MNNIYTDDVLFDQNTSPVLDLGHSEWVGPLYKEQTEDVEGAITIKYARDFASKVVAASLELEHVTEQQFDSLVRIIAALFDTVGACDTWFTQDIDVVASVEGEYCFYRKTKKGTSLLAIDKEGDIFYNFTGYKEGFKTKQYYYSNTDFEEIVYFFLAD